MMMLSASKTRLSAAKNRPARRYHSLDPATINRKARDELVSLSLYDRSLTHRPDDDNTYSLKGKSLIKLAHETNEPLYLEDALEAFNKANELYPNNAMYLLDRAKLHVDMGQYDLAKNDFDAAVILPLEDGSEGMHINYMIKDLTAVLSASTLKKAKTTEESIFHCVTPMKLPRTITLLSYNIDTNILRTEEGYARDAFPQWRANERAPYIINNLRKIIASQHPDIIQIQESRKFTTKFGDAVDSLSYLVDFFRAQGYEVITQPYNQTGEKAFQFITAFNPNTFKLESTAIKYLTKTPNSPTPRPSLEGKSREEAQAIIGEIREHNFGVEFERGVFITGLKDLETGSKLYSMNVHLDIPVNCRMQSSALMVSFVKEILAQDSTANVVISGDFNSFPEQNGDEQLRLLKEAILEGETIPMLGESTQDLHLDDGTSIDFSFIAFPYDFAANTQRLQPEMARLSALEPEQRRIETIHTYDRECQSLGGKLDHMFFSHGLKAIKTALIPALTTEERPLSYREDDVKQYIVRLARENRLPAFASDHQPICSTFQYK